MASESRKINFPVKHEIDVDIRCSGESTPNAISWLEGLDPKDVSKSRFHHPIQSSFIQYIKDKEPIKALVTLAGLNPKSPGRTNPGTPGTKHYDGAMEAKYTDKEGTPYSTPLDITELHKKLNEVYQTQNIQEEGRTWFTDKKNRWHRSANAKNPSSFFKDSKFNRTRAWKTWSGGNLESPGKTVPGTPNTPYIIPESHDYSKTIIEGKVVEDKRY